MGISERYTTKRNEKAPKKVEGSLHDYGSASGGTLLQTEYWPSRSLQKH